MRLLLAVTLGFVNGEYSEFWIDSQSISKSKPMDLVKEAWFTNAVDHMGENDISFQQRYFFYDKYWGGDGSPIFFYAGNEADVTKYVDATGLMWENVKSFKALLMFAEHRYYGESLIDDSYEHLHHDQALADYAALLRSFKSNHSASESPVIVFGGSYGGMLAAWFKFLYPDLVKGSIAASAPVLAFSGSGFSFYDDGGNSYWRVVTENAGKICAGNVRNAMTYLLNATVEALQVSFKLCKVPDSNIDVGLWIVNAFDSMSMGNYPFSSNYLTDDPTVFLPANPIAAACNVPSINSPLDALIHAVSVFSNASKQEKCFDIPRTSELDNDRFSGPLWTFQWCSEMLPEEFYFTMDGVKDMFFTYNKPFSIDTIVNRCKELYKGLRTDVEKVHRLYGTPAEFLGKLENVVFTNGLLDPWSSGSVLHSTQDMQERGIYVMNISTGAHHVDLMFSNPGDSDEIRSVRRKQMEIIKFWTNKI